MTAIKEFERLEALGLWRDSSHAQRREVVVSFGDSTLVLSDINNRPITHWSLAAIEHGGSGENGTIFTVDEHGEESLEIDDPLMIAAIGKIRNAIDASRPHPGRLRWFIGAITLLVFLGFSLFWLPNALTNYAAGIVPDSKTVEIGNSLIRSIEKTTGSSCTTPSGQRALRRFEDRVLAEAGNRILILEMGSRPSLLLPGGNILLNKSLTANTADANILAGYALMEHAAKDEQPPLLHLFETLGVRKTLGFLGTGNIDEADLERFADARLFGPLSEPNAEKMHELFKQAQIPHLDFAKHAKISDLANKPVEDVANIRPILSDSDWINLQEICSD